MFFIADTDIFALPKTLLKDLTMQFFSCIM